MNNLTIMLLYKSKKQITLTGWKVFKIFNLNEYIIA